MNFMKKIKDNNALLRRAWLALLRARNSLLLSAAWRPIGRRVELVRYSRRGFCPPAPYIFKLSVLRRYGIEGAAWIETGTFMGATTEFLASLSPRVISIEPSAALAEKARRRLAQMSNVTVICDLSENALPKILLEDFRALNFWLDGHFSEGDTFQGPNDTPIIQELGAIEQNLPRWDHVAVLIDDMRCFEPKDPKYSSYPSRSFLVDFANRNGLSWTLKHDIFVCWR